MALKMIKNEGGFSLVEIMVALVILALGLIALGKFQGTFISSGAESNRQAEAMQLAQKKVDDLRSFSSLYADWSEITADSRASWAEARDDDFDNGGKQPMAFEYIAANAGGYIQSGTVDLGANVYFLEWKGVDSSGTRYINYDYQSNSAAPTALADNAILDITDLKAIEVIVCWDYGIATNCDAVSNEQKVGIKIFLAKSDPTFSALATEPAIVSGSNPTIVYVPGEDTGDSPDQLPTTVNADDVNGDGLFRRKESTKAAPEVSQGGASNLVTFEVVTFNDSDNSIVKTESFATVNCTCTFEASAGNAFTPAFHLWNGTNVQIQAGGIASKIQGSTLRGGADGDADQPPECDTCCRDHHDVSGSLSYKTSSIATGNHAHYWWTDNSETVLEAVTSGAYLEACRLLNIAGKWQVFKDWNLVDVTTAGRDYFEVNKVDYEAHVLSLISEHYGDGTVTTLPDRNLSIPATTQGQLMTRALYIDDVFNNSLSLVTPATLWADLAEDENGDADAARQEARLENIPFYEQNMTLLADWDSDDTPAVTVTNEPIDTVVDVANDYYGSYSRGWGNAVGSANDDAIITATIRNTNVGLTGSIDITEPDASTLDDSMTVTISNVAPSSIIVSGTVVVTFGTFDSTKAGAITITDGCSILNGDEFTCSISSPWTGSIVASQAITTGAPSARCSGSGSYTGTAETGNITGASISFSCN